MEVPSDLPFSSARFIDTYNFRKYYTNHDEGEKTGRVIVLNELTFPVCIIDIDFENQEESYKDNFISQLLPLLPKNTVVVQTAHKGLHIYSQHKLYLKTNRFIKVQKSPTFDVDFFISGIIEKKSCLVCPPTRVIDKETGEELQYKFILNDFNVPDLPNVDEVIHALETITDMTPLKNFMDKHRNPPPVKIRVEPFFVNKIFADAIVDGICGFDIVDDPELDITKGVSIQYVFQALNSMIDMRNVTKNDIERYYKQIFDNNKISDNLRNNYNKIREEYANKKTKWNFAVKILKLYRKDFYKGKIIPLTKAK